MRGGASSENPWTSVWSQAEAQTRDIHMVFRISIQNPAVGVAMDADPRVSSSTSLHNAQNVLLFFLYHLSTTYLYIVLASSEVGPKSWGASMCLQPANVVWLWAGLWVPSIHLCQ